MSNSILHNEKIILERIAEGEEDAFKILYEFYYEELRPLVWKYADSGIDAKEILQETFMKVWISRDKLPEIRNFRAWIFKIASREYLIALRKKLNYGKRLDAYSLTPDSDNSPVTPYEVTHAETIKACVGEVISQLSPQRKAIYEMSRKEGLKIYEIAQQLSISPQTVKNVLQLVIKTIRQRLAAAGYGPFTFLIYFFTFF